MYYYILIVLFFNNILLFNVYLCDVWVSQCWRARISTQVILQCVGSTALCSERRGAAPRIHWVSHASG